MRFSRYGLFGETETSSAEDQPVKGLFGAGEIEFFIPLNTPQLNW